MPQPNVGDVFVSAAIQEAAIAYRNTTFIAPVLAPVVPVTKDAGKVPVFDKADWFRDVADTDRRPGTRAPRSGYSISYLDFRLNEMAQAHPIPDRVAENADRVVVMYAGRKVESGSRQALMAPPFHPYTDLLISSVPELRCGWLEQIGAAQPLPAMGAPGGTPALCSFAARCPARIDGVCNALAAPRHTLADGREILCHHSANELLEREARVRTEATG